MVGLKGLSFSRVAPGPHFCIYIPGVTVKRACDAKLSQDDCSFRRNGCIEPISQDSAPSGSA